MSSECVRIGFRREDEERDEEGGGARILPPMRTYGVQYWYTGSLPPSITLEGEASISTFGPSQPIPIGGATKHTPCYYLPSTLTNCKRAVSVAP